jgi:hypothetical protein
MKRNSILKRYLLLLVCGVVAATSLTACFSDNDDDPGHTFTPIECHQQLVAISGDYSGTLKWYPKSNYSVTPEYDSLKTDYTITLGDSTLRIDNLSLKMLTKFVDVQDSMAFHNAAPVTFEAMVRPLEWTDTKTYNTFYVGIGYYTYYMIPKHSITFASGDKQYEVLFHTNAYIKMNDIDYWPLCACQGNKMKGQILVNSVKVKSPKSEYETSINQLIFINGKK